MQNFFVKILLLVTFFAFLPLAFSACNNNGVCTINEDSISCPADCLPPSGEGKKWVLSWSDEFNGTAIDTTKWTVNESNKLWRGGRESALGSYVQNGKLVIKVFKDPADGNYIATRLTATAPYMTRFGYLEIRIKLKTQPGHWPAFWTYADEGGISGHVGPLQGGRDYTELDILEYVTNDSNKAYHNFHWDNGPGAATPGHTHRDSNFVYPILGYHVIGLDWNNDSYTIYVDGVKRHTILDSFVNDKGREMGISHFVAPLMITDEIDTVGDSFWADGVIGSILEAVLPDYSYVEYVRVFKRESSTPGRTILREYGCEGYPRAFKGYAAHDSNLVLTASDGTQRSAIVKAGEFSVYLRDFNGQFYQTQENKFAPQWFSAGIWDFSLNRWITDPDPNTSYVEQERFISAPDSCNRGNWPCKSFTYKPWGECQPNNKRYRTVNESKPAICEGGVVPVLESSCVYVPLCKESDWVYSDSSCASSNTLVRSWSKVGVCEGGVTKPATEVVGCVYNAPVCLYSYSLYGDCSLLGQQSRTYSVLNAPCNGGPVDLVRECTPPCTEDNFVFSLVPVVCPVSGEQLRSYSQVGVCVGGFSKPADSVVPCDYDPLAFSCVFSYGEWGECQRNGIKLRDVLLVAPEDCVGDPVLVSDCSYLGECVEDNWTFSDSACVDGKITREWIMYGDCTGGISHPAVEEIVCDPGNPVTYVSCQADDWVFRLEPESCPSSGKQVRYWSKSVDCKGGLYHAPQETVSCVSVAECTDADWEFVLEPEECPSDAEQVKVWSKVGLCESGVVHLDETVSCEYEAKSFFEMIWSFFASIFKGIGFG